jgi:hypothetical protein
LTTLVTVWDVILEALAGSGVCDDATVRRS